jgi:hypothetical protein
MTCSKRQREFIETLADDKHLGYQELLLEIDEVIDRPVTDIGQLTLSEASQVIDYLKGI